MIRTASTALALAAAFSVAAAAPALARKRHSSPDVTSESGSGKPVQVGTYGDWGAYLAKGKNKTCYALATPKERKPSTKHDAAYVFIANRPAEKVYDEVSIIMGYPMKENSAASAKVGSRSFDLIAKGQNAWIKNPADEAKFIEALKHSDKLIVKALPTKGPATTDRYSLSGVKQALERASKDCK